VSINGIIIRASGTPDASTPGADERLWACRVRDARAGSLPSYPRCGKGEPDDCRCKRNGHLGRCGASSTAAKPERSRGAT